MAKTMARIEDGVVVNIEWCSGNYIGDDSLVDIYDRPVGIGDTWDGTHFYRDGVRILTETESKIAALEQENKTKSAQIQALSDQNDFQEELIVELANIVYA